MVLFELYNKIDEEMTGFLESRGSLSLPLEEAIQVILSCVGTRSTPYAFLFETKSNHFVKVEVIENQPIISYMLDLFDFKSKFFG